MFDPFLTGLIQFREFLQVWSTVPTRKTRFFTAHFTKLAVTPMVFEIPKRNVPHLKDLKPGFRFQLKTFRKLQG